MMPQADPARALARPARSPLAVPFARPARRPKIPDPDPEIERKSFQVADGFEVNLFAADPLLAKPIQMNFDAGRPALGRLQRGLSADQAGPEGQRQDHHPRRHQGRRQGRQGHRLRRRPADPHRRRAGRRRRLRRRQHRAAAPQRHRRRRQGRPTPRRALRLRHRGHAPHPAHPPLGPGRHAVLQPVDLHPQPHRDAVRRAPAERRRHLAVPARDDASSRSSPAAGGTPGAITSTAGASRSSPTAPAARASTTSFPGAAYAADARRRRASSTASTPAARSTAAWRSSAAGTCPTTGRATCITNDFRGHRVCRFVLSDGRLGLRRPGDARADQDEPPGVPARST